MTAWTRSSLESGKLDQLNAFPNELRLAFCLVCDVAAAAEGRGDEMLLEYLRFMDQL